ncbi:DUF885 domain-containing protein [Gemmata sp.]|uniref:DUF885 domain-containing protein n=1 Tax=Gemmata sp. TaxID=1914242 RepID=UPI003F701201
MLRTATPVLLLGAALMALPDPTPAAQQKPPEPVKEDEVLKKLFLAWLAEEFEAHPLYATQQGNHEYDDRIDDLSPAARAKDLDRTRTWLARLPKSLERDELSRGAQIDLDIWTHSLNYAVWSAENDNRFTFDPRVYGEYVSDGVFLLLTQSTLPRERNVANAAKRVAQVPKVLAAAKASLKNPPKELTQVAIKRNLGAIAFFEKEIYTVAGETPGSEPLAAPCRAAVTALRNYQTYLETELLPKSNGEWRLGKEKFGKKLELELDAGLTADQVLKLAEDEADRVEREMWYVAKQLWARVFPGKPVPPDDATGRRAAIQAVLDELGKDHGKPGDLVSDARKTVANIKAFIRDKKILTLPDPDTCKIVEMPEFQRGFSLAYLNPAPPLDPKADSYYAIAPPPADWGAERVEALLREYNAAMLQVLTIHEAYPGHYVQLAYSNRNPSLVRKVLSSGTFAEGWAVYTEQMMLDQGYGGGDLSLRLHQLKFYQRAVLNAILDHKMHCTQLGDTEAKKMLMERGFQTEAEALGKVSRAKQSSTQLSTYFVGRTAFYKLRQEVSRARGDKFDLGKFHEAVLSHGTLPVRYLPELVK